MNILVITLKLACSLSCSRCRCLRQIDRKSDIGRRCSAWLWRRFWGGGGLRTSICRALSHGQQHYVHKDEKLPEFTLGRGPGGRVDLIVLRAAYRDAKQVQQFMAGKAHVLAHDHRPEYSRRVLIERIWPSQARGEGAQVVSRPKRHPLAAQEVVQQLKMRSKSGCVAFRVRLEHRSP